MRYSGHETFPFRYAWLPKAVRAVADESSIFSNEDEAIVTLGLGKNMVRAARFWTEAAGLIAPAEKGLVVTELGRELLLDGKLDPFLEDIQTLWLVHWMISTNPSPIAAWDFLLNKWHEPRITKSSVLAALQKLSEGDERKKELSDVTINQHFDIFLHTYIPTRSRKGDVQEDNLDSPLVELAFLQTEVTPLVSGRPTEPSYSFRLDEKMEISSALFAWCLERYWEVAAKGEKSIPFQSIAYGHGSPGKVFKITEEGIRQRLDAISQDTNGRFTFVESSSIPSVILNSEKPAAPLAAIYNQEPALAHA